jgi:O-antigen/teichoic acid export membrane protein
MGIVIRQSIQTTIISYLGVALGYINLLYLFPMYFSAEQVGLVRAIQNAALLLAPLAQVGLGQVAIKYFPTYGQEKSRKARFLGLLLLAGLAGYGVFLVLYLLFREPIHGLFLLRSPEVVAHFDLILLITLLLTLSGILEAWSRALLRVAAPNFVRDLLVRVFTTTLVVLFAVGYLSFAQVLSGLVVMYALALGVLWMYLRLAGEAPMAWPRAMVPAHQKKEMAVFAFYSLIGAGGSAILLNIDSLMVTSMVGLAANGIYSIVFFIALVIEIPRRAITQVATTLISRYWKENDVVSIDDLYKKTSLHQMIIGGLLLLGIVFNLENLFQFVPNGEVYRAGYWVVVIIGVGKWLDMTAGNNGEIIVMSVRYRAHLFISGVFALVTIGANWLLIPHWGINGAAIGSAFALVMYNLAKGAYLWIHFRLWPFSMKSLGVLLITGVTALAQYFLPTMAHPLADLVVRSLLIATIYGGLILGFGVSQEVNELVRRVIRGIRR